MYCHFGSSVVLVPSGKASLSSLWTTSSFNSFEKGWFIVISNIRALAQIAIVYRFCGHSRVCAVSKSLTSLKTYAR